MTMIKIAARQSLLRFSVIDHALQLRAADAKGRLGRVLTKASIMAYADPGPLKWASSVGASCVALSAALMLATSAVAQEAKSFAISESKAFLIPDDVLLDIRPVGVSVTMAIDDGLGIT